MASNDTSSDSATERANQANESALFAALTKAAKDVKSLESDGGLELKDGRRVALTVQKAASLSPSERDAVFTLFSSNMEALYRSSQAGYNAGEKQEELFHSDSRFLVARLPDTSALAGYSMFRFDREDASTDSGAETSSEDGVQIDVLYCYELQIANAYRGTGLGRSLMRSLEVFARAYGMEKVMLTVFTANTQARSFYKQIGYDSDPICPSNFTFASVEETPDYRILSKVIRPRSSRKRKKSSKKK